MSLQFSLIIPVYNRPAELEELLQSLTRQTERSFEVIVVEDGSQNTSEEVVSRYADALTIHYHQKPNSGPGPSRNVGFTLARGAYFIILDSDCIAPPSYLAVIRDHLAQDPLDAWGGPDKGHSSFTPLQQAMAYTMSAMLTTGGIRGNKRASANFQPRSFNMGVSRKVWEVTGGFQLDRFAEDIEWSIRIRKGGFRVGLIESAFVYHKRRTTLTAFFRQVWNFGKGRVLVGKAHPHEVKLTHWLPAVFTLGVLTVLLLAVAGSVLGFLGLTGLTVYVLALIAGAYQETHSVRTALLAVPCAFVQLGGYGLGFLSAYFR
ncbi:MAG: glycosyltransferase [Cyclobacteriaceae bacterium]|nr:glycosyltransferase [Cyclobacteriaceae bacterium]